MENNIAIVDYGMGNLASVKKALDFLDVKSKITADKEEILNSNGIILPGVGAFPDAMKNIKRLEIDKVLKKAVEKGIPLMGICLGMQLLFEESDEVKLTKGLGFFKGRIRKFEGDLKIPHMGWNDLLIDNESKILKGVQEGSYVYFVHSYYADIKEEDILSAHCEYGIDVPAVVGKDNVFGIQFHPEKSSDVGMKMLKNFWELVK